MQCASINNFNIETVGRCIALPAEVKAAFARGLILPNEFHAYANFSKAILVQSCVVGAVIARYDETAEAVEVVARAILPAFAGFGYEDRAVAQIEEDVRALSKMEECASYDALIRRSGERLSAEDVRLYQLRQALGSHRPVCVRQPISSF